MECVLVFNTSIASAGVLNKAPTSKITSPAAGATYTSPATIVIYAQAADSDGNISKVQFYNGNTLLGTDTSSPYSYTWSNVSAGSYTLKAKAYDNKNSTTTSSGVKVTVTLPNKPPTVSLTAPSNGSTYTSPANFTMSATASDSDGSISKVSFYRDSTLLGTDSSSPYSLSVSNLGVGTYSLTAIATDNQSATSTSSPVSVTVQSPNQSPMVTLTSPVSGSVYQAPATITLSATASDSDGTIGKVDFYQGSTLLNTDTTSPYSYTWSNVSAGSYSFYAKATDNTGAATSTITVSIDVQNVIDSDHDGVADSVDNCPLVTNTDQANSDADSFGNFCDNCPTIDNNDQADSNQNGIGDVCDVANANATLGMNLEQVGAVGKAWVFVDVFKTSTPFVAKNSNFSTWTGAPLDLDEEGWVLSLQPNQIAVTQMIDRQGADYPAGQYICLYDGQGTITFGGDASIVSQTPGRIVVQVNPTDTGKTVLIISATQNSDPIRNIRFLMPGFEDTYTTQTFHPEFLEKLNPFRVLRFLNWTRSNNSPLQSWSQRTKPTSQTQADVYGVAPEYIIELANHLGTDVWINIPHLADDDYITQLATLYRDELNPNLRVYIEYSNELWGIFTQGDWAESQGLAMGLSTDPFTARIRFHSQRSVEIFRIFTQVFGNTQRLVLGASHINPLTITEAMDWQNASLEADAVATAPYFAGRLGTARYASNTVQMTVSELLSAMDGESALANSYTQSNSSLVRAKGLDYIAYEGGQALYGQDGWENDSRLTNLFTATNRDPGMRALYLKHFTEWRQNGGGLFMGFVYASRYSSNGSWGFFESQQQDPATSYKWLGMMDFLQAYPQ